MRYDTFDGDAGYVYMKPVYGQALLDLDGKVVEIKGLSYRWIRKGEPMLCQPFHIVPAFFGGGSKVYYGAAFGFLCEALFYR